MTEQVTVYTEQRRQYWKKESLESRITFLVRDGCDEEEVKATGVSSEMAKGRIHPWIGLGWVGLGRIFVYFDGLDWVGSESCWVGLCRVKIIGPMAISGTNLQSETCDASHSSSDKYTCRKLMPFPCFHVVQ